MAPDKPDGVQHAHQTAGHRPDSTWQGRVVSQSTLWSSKMRYTEGGPGGPRAPSSRPDPSRPTAPSDPGWLHGQRPVALLPLPGPPPVRVVARRFPWRPIRDDGSLAASHIPLHWWELGPRSPSWDWHPRRGWGGGGCWTPADPSEANTSGTLEEQGQNEVGAAGREWAPGSGWGVEPPKTALLH